MSTTIEQWRPKEITPRDEQYMAARATQLLKSSLIPPALKAKPDDLMLVIATGHVLGLEPTIAVQQVFVVEGRPYVSSDALVSMAKVMGHTIRPTEISSTKCVVRAWRRDETSADAVTVTYTIDDAKAAGLAQKPNWKLSPQLMLLHRATRIAVKAVAPEVLTGIADAGFQVGDVGDPGTDDPVLAVAPQMAAIEAESSPVEPVPVDAWPSEWSGRIKAAGMGPVESQVIIAAATGVGSKSTEVPADKRADCDALLAEVVAGAKKVVDGAVVGVEAVETVGDLLAAEAGDAELERPFE